MLVDRTVTLRARTPHPDVSRCNGSPTPPNPTKHTVVRGATPGPFFPAFGVQANNVAIEGFVIQLALDNAGIYTSPAFSGYRIERNLIQENTIGLQLGSSGTAPSRVAFNCFRANNRPGSSSGNAVYSDQGLAAVEITRNRFFGNDSAGVHVTTPDPSVVPPPSNVTVSHNVMQENAGAGIIAVRTTGSRIDHNVVRGGGDGSAILVGTGNVGLRILVNILQRKYRGIHVRNDPFTFGFPDAPSTGLEIRGNIVQGMATDGLRVSGSSLESSLVSGNYLLGNGEDGIKVNALCTPLAGPCHVLVSPGLPTAGNGGNTFLANVASGNALHDCHDATQGTGTAGTASTWAGNSGATANRAGICSPGQVVPPFDHDPFP